MLINVEIIGQVQRNLARVLFHPAEEIEGDDADSVLIHGQSITQVFVEGFWGAEMEPLKVVKEALISILELDGFLDRLELNADVVLGKVCLDDLNRFQTDVSVHNIFAVEISDRL